MAGFCLLMMSYLIILTIRSEWTKERVTYRMSLSKLDCILKVAELEHGAILVPLVPGPEH